MKKFNIPLPLCASILAALFLSGGCSEMAKIAEIDFSDTVSLENPGRSHESEINICVGSMITPKEGHAYYKALLDYIGRGLKMKVNFIEKESYLEVNSLLEEGKIDIAFVCGGPYIDGKEKFGLQLLVAPQVDGRPVYYSYIITRKTSDIDCLEDLGGKTFVFVDPMSNTGKIYPAYLLKQISERPETFFKEYIYSYAHDTSIRAVSEGIVDGGSVDSLIWNYMDKNHSRFTKNTKIIKISPAYGIPPVVVRPGLQEDLKERIKKILLDMENNPEGNSILEKMHIDKFVEAEDSDYDSIREIKRYLER